MPSRRPLTEQPSIERRAAQAQALLKSVDRLWARLPNIPSFTGKARFMDAVRRTQTLAHNLAWDLARDVEQNQNRNSEGHSHITEPGITKISK